MRFRKIQGAGNDFVLLTDSTPDSEKDWSKEAERLSARRTGVGADGLVISSLISISPVVLEVGCFNADSSTATMCGNALRCTAWAAHHDHSFREMSLRMAGVTHEAIVSDHQYGSHTTRWAPVPEPASSSRGKPRSAAPTARSARRTPNR